MSAIFLPIAGAVVGAYLTGSFIQTVMHRWLGHAAVGSFFHRRHVLDHHRIYSPRHRASAEYSDVERSLTPYYAVPVAALIALLSKMVPPAPLTSFTATMLISYALHAYLHKHYHLQHSWLAQSRWFRRLRELHYVHHYDARRNYAVIDLFWDRLFGTFKDSRRETRPC